MMIKLIALVLLCCCASAHNILGFFPVPFKSHYSFAKPLLSELSKRGHNLTIYTVFPDKIPPNGYREIDISQCSVMLPSYTALVDHHVEPNTFKLIKYFRFLIPQPKYILNCTQLQELLQSTDHFDLFLTDLQHIEWYAGFAHKFQLPMINVFPNILYSIFIDVVGGISNPCYAPIMFSGLPPKMNFRERLYNTYLYLTMKIFAPYYATGPSQALADEVFGKHYPRLEEIVKNTSITLFNTYYPYHPPLPLVPSLVQVGGMNIKVAQKLPEVGIDLGSE